MNKQRQQFIAFLTGLALVFIVVIIASYLVVAGRNVEQALAPIVGFIGPLILLLFGFAGVSERLQAQDEKLETIHQQVNGNNSALVDKADSLQSRLEDAQAELNGKKGGETG